MSNINNDEVKSIIFDLSKSLILPKYKRLKESDIKIKNKADFVTTVDIEVENELEKILLKLLPNSLFVGEESYSRNPNIISFYKENKYCWAVDPIDGTKNFIKGNDKFAVMIGLTFKDTILQSWIYKPITNEFSYAKLNEGSFIDDKKYIISKQTDISNSIGSISTKYWNKDYESKMRNFNKNIFKEINSYGCIAFEYVDIAKSKRDFAILSKLHPWDHIPGILLVKEAGGSILHFDKSEYNHGIKKNNLVVTNSTLLQNKIFNLIGSK